MTRTEDGIVQHNRFLVSKETVVVSLWKSEKKNGFIKGVNKGSITIVKDFEIRRFER